MGEARRRRFAVLDINNDALERLSESDQRFFNRTGRKHRLRLAGRAEVDALVRVHGSQAARLPTGERMFALVKVPFDGAQLKQFVPNKADAETDVPEEFIAALFDRLSSRGPEIGVLEAELRRRVDEDQE